MTGCPSLFQIDPASMELAHSLLLNEEALSKISDSKKPVFIFEWLRFLDKVLVAAQKVCGQVSVNSKAVSWLV